MMGNFREQVRILHRLPQARGFPVAWQGVPGPQGSPARKGPRALKDRKDRRERPAQRANQGRPARP